MKWVWVGLSRTLAALESLSFVFGEQWMRGWLAWVLKRWAGLIHSLALHLPIHLTAYQERAVTLFVIVAGIVGVEPHINPTAPTHEFLRVGKQDWMGLLFDIGVLTLGLLITCFWLVFAVGEERTTPLLWAMAVPGFVLLAQLLYFTGRRATLLTFGIAVGAIIVNFAVNASGFVPPPPNVQ